MTASRPPSSTARTLRFSVAVPGPQLSPNHRGAWQTRQKPKHAQRDGWGWGAKLAWAQAFDGQRPFRHATLDVAVRWCTGRREKDPDNLWASLKSGIDGLTDAGVIHDDSPRYLTLGNLTQVHCRTSCSCGGNVTVTLREDS